MKQHRVPGFLVSLAFLAQLSVPAADLDWPRWRGPSGNGQTPAAVPGAARLAEAAIAWETQVGLGYSSVTVADGRAFTLGHDMDGHETVFCLDAATGKVLWKHSYPAELMPAMHAGGPNASPTVDGGRVFTVSKDGQAFALGVTDGTVLWKVDLKEALGIKAPVWGFASSPLLVDDHLVFSAGRTIALNPDTGATVWRSTETYHPGYATPAPFESEGRTLLAAFDGKGLSILDAGDGGEIARHPFKTQYDMTAADPIVLDHGDRIFISAISQGEFVRFDGKGLSSVETTRDLRNSMNTSIIVDGHLYGIDGKHRSSQSRLVCVRLSDGKTLWEQDKFGYGTLIASGDILVIQAEAGDLVAVKASPEGYQELSRRPVLDGICWTPPVLAGNALFVRNEPGRVVRLNLP